MRFIDLRMQLCLVNLQRKILVKLSMLPTELKSETDHWARNVFLLEVCSYIQPFNNINLTDMCAIKCMFRRSVFVNECFVELERSVRTVP